MAHKSGQVPQIKATYVDHMGSDLSVVNAARVSFGKKSYCEETPLTREQQIELVETAKQRREEKLKHWIHIDWSEKSNYDTQT